MGGGHLTRPDFGQTAADPAHPLTEFYLLLQAALDKSGAFALPELWAGMQAPARRIYAAEAHDYLRLSSAEKPGYTRLLSAGRLNVLYSELRAAPGGAPAALVLTEECTRAACAVRLLPPVLWDEALPPVPECASAIELQLTFDDMAATDANAAALGRRLALQSANKRWLSHPRAEKYLAQQVALLQRIYR